MSPTQAMNQKGFLYLNECFKTLRIGAMCKNNRLPHCGQGLTTEQDVSQNNHCYCWQKALWGGGGVRMSIEKSCAAYGGFWPLRDRTLLILRQPRPFNTDSKHHKFPPPWCACKRRFGHLLYTELERQVGGASVRPPAASK